MRINEFRITRYGQPLPDTGKVTLQEFNLISGENEDCKTLTIDALVKMMLGKNVKDFENINRVDETPEGHMILKDNAGKEFKIPEKGNLTKITGLTASECRNIFVIRNSDLDIGSPKFYVEIADRLVGLRTNDLDRIRDRLREIGKLTAGDAFTNKDGQLKTRMDSCPQLLETIDGLVGQITSFDLEKSEVENVRLSEELDRIQNENELLESARKREKYEKGVSALAQLETDKQSYSETEIFNQKDEETWRDAQREIESLAEQKTGLLGEIDELKKTMQSSGSELDSKKTNFVASQNTKQKITDEIKPELRVYAEKRYENIKHETNGRLLNGLCIFSSALALICLLGVILSSSIFIYAFVVSGFLAAAFWFLKYRFNANNAKLSLIFESIRLKTAPLNLDDTTAEGILLKIQKFEDDYQIKNSEIEALAVKTGSLKGKLVDLADNRIPRLETQIGSLKSKIDLIKDKSKMQSLADYSQNLQTKITIEKSTGEQEKILESHFQRKGRNQEENIINWKAEIDGLKDFKEKAKDTRFDEKQITTLKTRQSQITARQNEINQEFVVFREQMEKIGEKANFILQAADSVRCAILPDLSVVRKRIVSFYDNTEKTKKQVLDALSIFGEIQKEELSKVADLFGDKSSISTYFEEITGGSYKRVMLNTGTGAIQVERRNGDKLDAEKLSAGTYDQLYLCIRLALGEKLLKGNKGFFIFDDPFIKSDSRRLKNQMSMLKRISELGWQVVYFTAKDEVQNALTNNAPTNFASFTICHGAISKVNPA